MFFNSIFASNDLSDNCHDEISHSNDLDAVVESESPCEIMSLSQVNRIFLRFRGRLALGYDGWVKFRRFRFYFKRCT